MLTTGTLLALTLLAGMTTRRDGAAPKLHIKVAPLTTSSAIAKPPPRLVPPPCAAQQQGITRRAPMEASYHAG